jgi:hypothetical protein
MESPFLQICWCSTTGGIGQWCESTLATRDLHRCPELHDSEWTTGGVREVVTEDGGPVPPGSAFFEMNPDGTRTSIRKF